MDFENFKPTEEQMDRFEELKDAYSEKSEEEIFFEIIKINEKMESEMTKEEYEELFEKLDSIRPLLNEEQLEKLDRLLDILGR
mgnify:CR=1 FL=1